MMRVRTIVIFFCLLGMLPAAAAWAQPRWGRERYPTSGACFFEDINYKGRYFCVARGERLPSLPSGMGDRVSSIRLFGGGEVVVYSDRDMHGRSARYARDANDLRHGGWNDKISSLEVHGNFFGGASGGGEFPLWGHNQPLPRHGACFYEDANYRGNYFCVDRGKSYSSLPRGFNDKISSIRVFDAHVRIFQDHEYRGRSHELHGDERDLRGSWRDVVSSLRVY